MKNSKLQWPLQTIIRLILPFIFCVSCSDNHLFSELNSDVTNIQFENKIIESDSMNILNYLYMYNGGGVAIGDINNDGLSDIYFGSNQGENKLYINRGNFSFEDITENSGVGGINGENTWTNGVSFVDINSDGWMDIYVCQLHGFLDLEGQNQLYINNGDGTFNEQAAKYGLDIRSYSQEASFFDYDLDGDLDMFLVNMSMKTPETYRKADLRKVRDSLGGDRLYENQNGTYKDVSERAGIYGGIMGYGLSVGISDINTDGYPDIYVSNDFHENDYLYYNKGDGTFEERVKESMEYTSNFSMGSDIADINNDLKPDIFTLDMKPYDIKLLRRSFSNQDYDLYKMKNEYGYHDQFPRNMLQLNEGQLFGSYSSFRELGEFYGVDATDWSWGTLIADFNLDGKKDIFITNGIPRRPNDLDFLKYTSNVVYDKDSTDYKTVLKTMPIGEVENKAFENKGNSFIEVSKEWGLNLKGCSNGVSYGDLDNDGDLDLVLNNLNSEAVIYKNNTIEKNKANYLKIHLNGNSQNKDAIGAKVTVKVNNTFQVQEIYPVRGWLSAVDPAIIFGLGPNKRVDSLWVNWNDGKTQVLSNVNSNQQISLNYKEAVFSEVNNGSLIKNTSITKPLFIKWNEEKIPDYWHKENDYIDFDYEPLLPKMVSTQGPRMAIGDVNNDGLIDFYIGGGKNQAGAIYLQQEDHEEPFRLMECDDFFKDRAEEDVEATFIDVNNDNLLDLYVVSGSGEVPQDLTGKDRLYINLGNNNFKKSYYHPQLSFNGSCVTKGDFNNDGIDDLFVGGRSVPGSYGKYPSSRILLGDGKGKLYDYTPKMFGNNLTLGMVTDAAWIEDKKELIVVGDWMPITLLNFSQEVIKMEAIENTSGWWNTIEASDVDDDGDLDLLVGNMGLNSFLKASKEFPVNLYIKDFDNNSSIDPIVSYYEKEKELPLFGLDKLSDQLVVLKKLYPSYEKFSNSGFKDIFTEEELFGAGRWQAKTFKSILLTNNGEDFTVKSLPEEMQMSPIYSFKVDDFNNDGNADIIAGGNFYGSQLRLGKQAASYGQFLKGDGKGNWETVSNKESGFSIQGEIRDIQLMEIWTGERIILVSRNNNRLEIFNTKD